MGAILALEHLKLDAERDKINIIAVGDQNVLAQALEAGTIDATVLDGVQSRRLSALGFSDACGFEQGEFADPELRLRHARAQHSKESAMAENLMKAVIEGAAFSLSLSQKPNTLKILQKYLRVTEKDAEEGYRDLVIGTDKKPYAAPAGVTNVVRLMKRSQSESRKC